MYAVCSLAIQPTPSCMPFPPLWMHSRHACCSWPSGPVNSVYPACAKQGDRIQTILLKITSAWLEKVRVPDHGPPEKKDLIFSSCSDSTEERGHPRATAFVHIGRWTHSPFLVEKGHGKTKVCFFGRDVSSASKKNGITKLCVSTVKTQHGACGAFLIGGYSWMCSGYCYLVCKEAKGKKRGFTTCSKGSTHPPLK